MSSNTETAAHTCYVEVWPHYRRIFNKSSDLVEVCNDQGAAARMFQLLREKPKTLLEKETTEQITYQKIIQAWSDSQHMPLPASPGSIEELQQALLAPYHRLKTVLFEALPWRECLERYNDPRALLILEPPWSQDQRDEWAALQLRLARARFQWELFIPHHLLSHHRFPAAHTITRINTTVCLASQA